MTIIKPEVIESHIVHQSRAVRFISQQVRLHTGETLEKPLVDHPGAVAIVPFLPEGQVILIRQYRLTAQSILLEIPAGTLEVGENPRACAERELQEEIGYFPETLISLGQFYVAPGISNEIIYLFAGYDLRPSRLPSDIDEMIETDIMPLSQARDLIARGQIQDAKTIVGLLRVTE